MYALARNVAEKRVRNVELLIAALPSVFPLKLLKRLVSCQLVKKEVGLGRK